MNICVDGYRERWSFLPINLNSTEMLAAEHSPIHSLFSLGGGGMWEISRNFLHFSSDREKVVGGKTHASSM